MIRPRWRKVWRDLWLHRGRSILVVLAIAIGLAGGGTVLNTWALVERATSVGFLASQPASAVLRTDSVDGALLAAIRSVPGVALAEGRREVAAAIQSNGRWQSARLFVADDFAAVRVGRLALSAGVWPTEVGTIAIERSSVEFAGLAIGDVVPTAVADSASRSLRIVGIGRDVGLAPGWMEHVVYGFVSRATAVTLGLPDRLDQVRVVVAGAGLDRAAVRRIAYRVKARIEATGRTVGDVTVPEPGEHVHAAQMNSLLYVQGAFGALALVLCGFLVVNLMSAMLAQEARQIGVLKAIGGRRGQLWSMYLGFALVLGLLATALGLPVAIWLGRLYGGFKAELLNFEVAGVAIPGGSIMAQIAVGCLVPVVAAAVPVSRTLGLPVAALLSGIGVVTPSESGWAIGPRGWSRLTLLGIRNVTRRRGRVILTLTVLAMGGAIYLGAANLRVAIAASVDAMFSQQRFAVSLRLATAVPHGRVETIAETVEGVGRAEGWAGVRAAIPRDDGTLGESFVVTGLPVPSPLLAPVVLAGRWLETSDERGLVVSRSWLKQEPDVAVGDSVTLLLRGERERFAVVGVLEAGPTPTVYGSRDVLAGPDGLTAAVMVATELTGLGAQVDLIQRLRTALSEEGVVVATSQRQEENRRVIEDHLVMVADFLGVMGWVLIAVGGMGLAATMGLNVMERTREIAVLKALGARHGAILGLVQTEGLVIGLASWVAAVPLSVPVSLVLGRAFGRIMFEVPTRYLPSGNGIGWWLGLVVVVSVVASAGPATRAMRVVTRAALSHE